MGDELDHSVGVVLAAVFGGEHREPQPPLVGAVEATGCDQVAAKNSPSPTA
ncbi:MAG: hypothetical protein R2715_22895 [Ilumatobacteraceae bacterium]